LSIDATSSVVVHDLDVLGAAGGPGEADPPLVVDPDAVLTSTVIVESPQPVARWRPEIVEVHCGIEVAQIPKPRSGYPGVPERPDHASNTTQHVKNVTR
jgi:hypothetical protein